MTFKKLFAASLGLALTVGIASSAFAQQQQQAPVRTQELSPSFKSTVNVDVIDTNNRNFTKRVKEEMVDRPAPQVGQTRAAIEALYGPSFASLAPNKEYEIYTNEWDLTDGKRFHRNISQEGLRIYEVTYSAGPTKTPNDKAADVKLRVIPQLGDHKNLVTKMMGGRPAGEVSQNRQHIVFGIPKNRFVFYNDILSTPFETVNMYFNADGNLVGQEFMPQYTSGQYVITSAGRYVENEGITTQIDRKVGW